MAAAPPEPRLFGVRTRPVRIGTGRVGAGTGRVGVRTPRVGVGSSRVGLGSTSVDVGTNPAWIGFTALQTADTAQETGRAKLPKTTEEFYVAKAELYFTLKQINRAGYAAYVDDRVGAGRYNLAILHRRAAARKETPKPAPEKSPVSVN